MAKKVELKLFVFEGFCPDYTNGLAFAIAEDEIEARNMIQKDREERGDGSHVYDWGEITMHPIIQKIARSVSGGG